MTIFRKAGSLALLILLSVPFLSIGLVGDRQNGPSQNRLDEYNAEVPKTIVQLQLFRQSSSMQIRSKAGREGIATLTNLNPAINAWYVLEIAWKDQGAPVAYHLENPEPGARRLMLDEKRPTGIVIANGGSPAYCDLFEGNTLDQAKASSMIYYPLCGGQIYLRNAAIGHRTSLEAATEFLREHVWGGESIIALGHILMGEAHRESAKLEAKPPEARAVQAEPGALPRAAEIDAKYADKILASGNLGMVLRSAPADGMMPGAWYEAADNPGIYVSLLQPNLIDPAILQSYRTAVHNLDGVEASSLCYSIAFDLARFDLGYARGTEHPAVTWSDHMQEKMKDSKLPGPDGIGNISPLVSTGLIGPEYAGDTVATFTGGFKRHHGAFKYGDLSLRNHGSHYGFVENGVIFSKPQPGLATIFVLNDGSIEMRTWTETDQALLAKVKHARQNGVALIEFDAAIQSGVPGSLVNLWGAGNWSGSEDMKLRTMRSGAAIQRNHGKRFLIYAVFSDATPSAMARVFRAYHCDYAMLLDMNALEHTYLAVYRRSGSQIFVDHLIKGMDVLDRSATGELVPRFLGYADNRDFFYVTRRRAAMEAKP